MSRREKIETGIEKTRQETKSIKRIFSILILLIIFSGIAVTYFYLYPIINKNISNNKFTYNNINNQILAKKEKEDRNNIYSGNQRPIAVMLDNSREAWPQSSINEAYLVYEIIVEGAETRLMACYKNKDIDNIGSVRSARSYFIDYAMENDAIFAHMGQSPGAKEDIERYCIPDVNGLYYDTGKAKTNASTFWRVNNKKAPHNCYTSTSQILKTAKKLGYSIVSKKESVLRYAEKEINLGNTDLQAINATNVVIPFSNIQNVKYKYDEKSKSYIRFARDKKQTDELTDEEVKTKNIIITFAENYDLDDGTDKNRQVLKNIGNLDGYYITNGKAIKIKCIKESRKSRTIYSDLKGNEININDGNTFIEICPKDSKVIIK